MKSFFTILLYCMPTLVVAQDINWNASSNSNQVIYLNTGLDYSMSYGVSYSQKLESKSQILVGTSLSLPYGSIILDDWKFKANLQFVLWKKNSLILSAKPEIVIRRYESDVSEVLNIATAGTMFFGYYKAKWNIATEINYERNVLTNLKHKSIREFYPDVKDGWYQGNTGNIKIGIVTSYSLFESTSVFLNTGMVFGHDFQNNSTLPFYGTISIQQKL